MSDEKEDQDVEQLKRDQEIGNDRRASVPELQEGQVKDVGNKQGWH